MIGNKFVDIKRGQLLTGRNKLSEYTGINRSKLERLLNLLESEQQIEQLKTTKYRLISIVNYDAYQSTEQQVSNERATSEQQVSTNKNVNNKKNENNKQDKIPYQLIADTYNECFSNTTGNPSVAKLTNQRKAQVKKLWNFDITNENANLLTNNIDYWKGYLNHCATLPFFQSDFERGETHKNWQPNFDFVMKEKTLIDVKEKKYK